MRTERNYSRREWLALSSGALAYAACSSGTDIEPASSIDPTTLHYESLRHVARLIESKQVSAVELTRALLERIERLEPRLHSYATVTAERALATAEAADRAIQSGDYRGPLHGMPIAVKDLCYTKGVRTMGGLQVLADFEPDFDATVISKLEQAGAVLLGKLALTEGAMAGYHRDFDIPVNPWGEDLWAGASSSGSGVATAAGLCFASLGSDTGGSIRFPSMANGTVGLKPTYGRVSRYGVLALAESLDHVGPMTCRVVDAAIVFEAIAGSDPNDPTSLSEPVPSMLAEIERGTDGLRVGFDRSYATDGVAPDLASAIETALGELEGLGVAIVDVAMPPLTPELQQDWFTICSREAANAHAANYPSRADEYGEYFREFLALGSSVTDEAYQTASDERARFTERFRAALSEIDAIACPSGGAPFTVSHEVQYGSMAGFDPVMPKLQMQFTVPADFAGTPALSFRCGFSESGVPHTLQLLGSALSEPVLCRMGHAYEEATNWHERHPEL